MLTQPVQFTEAHDFIATRVPRGERWDSAKWARQERDVRERAFFSARVENVRFLQRAKDLISDFQEKSREEITLEDGTVTTALKVGSRADFVKRLRAFMVSEGMAVPEDFQRINNNDLQDIRALSRLQLIFDTNTAQAYGFADYEAGLDPVILDAFPAARFIRNPGADEKRQRHRDHEGEIRLKDDLAWWAAFQNGADIGGFEVPWAPYGFRSHMDREDVSRRDAEAEGLIEPGERVTRKDGQPTLNENLKASLRNVDPQLKDQLLRELNSRNISPPRTRSDDARSAARSARRSAIERSLAAAQDRGDEEEERRIETLLRTEDDLQREQGRGIRYDEEFGEVRRRSQNPVIEFITPAESVGDGSLVSSKLKAGRNLGPAKSRSASITLEAIDSVHSDGPLPVIEIVSSRSRKFNGAYIPAEQFAQIKIAESPTPSLTIAHEIGHFIDHRGIRSTSLFPKRGDRVNDFHLITGVGTEEFAPFVRAARESRAFQSIVNETRLTTASINYLASPHEVWARAYAQFIAVRSNNPTLLAELESTRSQITRGRSAAVQWDDDDFAPIDSEIERIFRTRGWL